MIQSGPIQPGPGVVGGHHTDPPPPGSSGGMFGPIIGPPDYSHHQPIGKSVSATNIGVAPVPDPVRGPPGISARSSHTPSPAPTGHAPSPSGNTPSPTRHVTATATSAASPITTSEHQQPQPASSNTTAANTKIARQEQLVKKLVLTLPGSTEEHIRQYIQVLRVKHGKLSGWPTSKIASHIAELMKNEQL